MKYVHRILAALYLLVMTLWSHSVIGDMASDKALTWIESAGFVSAIAVAMSLGWHARMEYEKDE